MASSKTVVAFVFVFFLLLFHIAEAHYQNISQAPSPSPSPQTIDCGFACGARCRLSKRPNLCKRSCGSCCAKCKCVPSGTSGNHHLCPCYANLTTRNKFRKCP